MQKTQKILVTAALPYANGSIHLGHLVEYIQSDIWVRWQKLQNKNTIFVCGDDAHGTPIMISAQKLGISPEELVAKVKIEHETDFRDFLIEFDNYYTTHSPENQELAETIYEKLRANGDIETKSIEQAFDEKANMFLPDRYVKGICPRCKAKDQYGDNCEVCGATYSTTDLIDPISTITNTTPIRKSSMHYFFKLENYAEMLKNWIGDKKHLQPEIANKLKEWLDSGLKSWDISRDAPYFGFKIPDTENKYFYVWLDAPIGYMASFKNLCAKKTELNFAEYWQKENATELYHFMGKDIVYFHSLFWPAMLEGSGFRKPTSIFVHGYLTINGQKMSKSRGTFITARDYLKMGLNPEYLRYYYAAKLSNSIDDIDLNFTDFANRVNSDLVGKVVNIASRTAGFINKNFAGKLAKNLDNLELFNEFIAATEEIAKNYENLNYNAAMREIMALADKANKYVDDKKPWVLAKDTATLAEVQNVATMGLNLFRLLILFLKPVLPKMASDTESFLKIPPLNWNDLKTPLLDHEIGAFTPLMQRVDVKSIQETTYLNSIPEMQQSLKKGSETPTKKCSKNLAWE